MLVKILPRCNNFITDTTKSGNVACCMKVAAVGTTLANGKVWNSCVDCLATRITILADNIDTASFVFYVKDKD